MQISRASINFWIDIVVFLIFVICTISGLAIMDAHDPHGGYDVLPGENGANIESINEEATRGITGFD